MNTPASALALLDGEYSLVHHPQTLVLSAVVVDRSGSMSDFRREPLDGLRQFITDLKSGPSPERVAACVVSFASDIRMDQSVQLVKDIDPSQLGYVASGQTKLYAAVYSTLYLLLTLHSMRRAAGLNTQVLLTVLTDGEDNLSPEQQAPCRELSAIARVNQWELAVIGFGLRGLVIGAKLGFNDPPPDMHRPSVHDQSVSRGSFMGAISHATRRTHLTVTGIPVPPSQSSSPPSSH